MPRESGASSNHSAIRMEYAVIRTGADGYRIARFRGAWHTNWKNYTRRPPYTDSYSLNASRAMRNASTPHGTPA
jgi:hypothetical protein